MQLKILKHYENRKVEIRNRDPVSETEDVLLFTAITLQSTAAYAILFSSMN